MKSYRSSVKIGFPSSVLDASIDSEWLDVSRHSVEFIHWSESSVNVKSEHFEYHGLSFSIVWQV